MKGGQLIEPSSVSSMLSILDQTSQTAGIAAALFGPLGALPAAIGGSKSREAGREKESSTVSQSLFHERTLNKGKEETGVAFFRLPKGVKAEDRVSLSAWVVKYLLLVPLYNGIYCLNLF